MKTLQQRRQEKFFQEKLEFSLGPAELKRMIDEHEPVVIVDVRDEEAYDKGHVPGARHIPRERWMTTSLLDRGKTHVVYCYNQQCHLAAKACLELSRRGFRVMELEGGMSAWEAFGYLAERREIRVAA
jgi:rhodanese-related sulfurtransferase